MFFDDTRYGEAKAVCAGCPLRTACLAYALECEEFGVWGGATPEERTSIRGTQSVWTPEERLLAQELRDRLASGQPMRSVAEWSGVTERTLYRWVAEVESSAA
jgi:WhiB family redox-sensing transcriptional regulator